MTYFEALGELQQRGIDALGLAQSTQLTALKSTREIAAALTEAYSPMMFVPLLLSDMSALLTAFTFQLLEQQVAYAKQITDAVATPVLNAPSPSLAATPVAVLEATPVATIETTPEAIVDLAPGALVSAESDPPAHTAASALEPTSDVAPAPPTESTRTIVKSVLMEQTPTAVTFLSEMLPAPNEPTSPRQTAPNAIAAPEQKPEQKPKRQPPAANGQKIASVTSDRDSVKRRPSGK